MKDDTAEASIISSQGSACWVAVLLVASLGGCAQTPVVDPTVAPATVARVNCPPSNPRCNVGDIDVGPVIDPDTDACPVPISVTLDATPSTILQGQSASVSWAINYPFACKPPKIALNGIPVAPQGSVMVSPMSNQPYAITLGAIPTAHMVVFVVLPSVVRIKGSTDEWRRLLIQAIGDPLAGFDHLPPGLRPGRTVLLWPDVDMDLTYYENLLISQGVTLTSEMLPPGLAPGVSAMLVDWALQQGPVARNAIRVGPRLYTRSRPKPLFHIQCNGENIFGDRVRISGFRIQGPHYNTEEGDDNLERGIMVTSCVGVDISNMEISGWSGQAIYVVDPVGSNQNFDDVKIHGNFLHHNQHRGGNGYGVVASAGAKISIERNLFDFNRHAISASGQDGTGYRARLNLVLKGGGFHDDYPVYGNYYTHQFDVHGTKYCNETLNIYPFGCGQAGDTFEIARNAFQYTSGNAIKVRGNPTVGAVVASNIFAHDGRGDAIVQNGNPGYGDNITNPIDVQGNNKYDIDTYGKYGVCDFDGDGRDDLFLATGASWWYASAGRREWRFLNDNSARLSEVGLGDFDGDGKCDVLAVHIPGFVISKGGTEPFTVMPGEHRNVPFSQLAFGDFNGDRIQDIFRRAPDGQWWAISPGVYPWTPLQSSSFPLSDLRFGDFDGNGITDVISISGGKWAVSWGARTTWKELNPTLSSSLANVFIGDIDGVKGDDIVRYVRSGPVSAKWEVSSGGAGPWVTLTSISYPNTIAMQYFNPSGRMTTFVGRFDIWQGADVLALEFTRGSRIFSKGHTDLAPYGLYAY